MSLLPPARDRLAGVAAAVLGAAVRSAGGPLGRWSAGRQLTARRNALVAATALARRRAEREEAERALAVARGARRASGRRAESGT